MSKFYRTDPTDPEAPQDVVFYHGIVPGDQVRYQNPKAPSMPGTFIVTEMVDFGDYVLAILNDGELEVSADNLVLA